MRILRQEFVIILAVLLISQIALSSLILTLSTKGAKQRTQTQITALQVQQESYSLKCLLLIPNTERTQDNIDRCDTEGKAKVESNN